jgi:formamidopyrimidine-DNA glycosylase
MPELPEVETVCRGMQKTVSNLKITDVRVTLPKLINTAPAQFRQTLIGRTILCTNRRAKVIIIQLSGGYYLLVHLKMSGQLLYQPKTAPVLKHTHIIFSLNNKYQLRFRDQRQFGYIKLADESGKDEFFARMNYGPEPLAKTFTLESFKALLKTRSNSRIKPLLMDPTFISGIGNLYADEILFYAKIYPLRKASSLTDKEIKMIYQGIKQILAFAIKKRGSSVELYVDIEGKRGGFVPYIKAYDREDQRCHRCKTPIKRIKIGSRSAYFCPQCQPGV